MTQYISNAAAIVMCDALADLLDVGGAGSLRIYAGTVPSAGDASLGAATLLAQLALSNPAFGGAVDVNPGARATANSITQDSSADATGTATFFRLVNNAGTSVYQGTVTATGGGGDLELVTTSIVSGQPVQVSSLTMTVEESRA